MMALINHASNKLLDNVLPKPPKENLNTNFVLGEIVDHISLIKAEFPEVKLDLLKSHLWEIRNKSVDPKVHIRGFLRVFEETPSYRDALAKLTPGMQSQIQAFIDGKSETEIMAADDTSNEFHLPASPSVIHHMSGLEKQLNNLVPRENERSGVINELTKVLSGSTDSTVSYPTIFEDNAMTRIMEVHNQVPFNNWGVSVQNTPKWSFVPKTVLGLQNLVRWAKDNHFRVRCSGYRHSWSSTFSEDNQILVSLLNLESVTKLPDPMSISPEHIDPDNELKSIQVVEPRGITVANGNALVKMGVSVTNEEFRRWSVKNNKWALPVDVILVEVTIGGVNGPICHGAGRRHKTVNDCVRAVEYIDCNGILQSISDPEQLSAAAGHFGLLGIVTHITFEVEPMSYALLQPIKPDIGLAIPPLKREDIPIALRKTFTDAQYTAALVDFKKRASEDYYSEWFWFTRNEQAWVNSWNPISDPTGAVEYPGDFGTWLQWVEGWLGGVMTTSLIFQALPGRWQAAILATFGMVVLPPFEFLDFKQEKPATIKCALPNALHFRRGIQNCRVRDMEFQIPIPALASDPTQPDYSVVQRAWWDVINLCYEDDSCPMRLTLELRIMSDSALIMAPQSGNTFGTASIEIISIPDAVTDGEWVPFLQKVSDKWMSYTNAQGKLLNVRPHWAKEWESIEMRGQPARQYLREVAYKEAIPKFRGVLEEIGRRQGWGLDDIKERFSNELWDYLVYSQSEGLGSPQRRGVVRFLKRFWRRWIS